MKKPTMPWEEKVHQTLTRSVDPNVRPPERELLSVCWKFLLGGLAKTSEVNLDKFFLDGSQLTRSKIR